MSVDERKRRLEILLTQADRTRSLGAIAAEISATEGPRTEWTDAIEILLQHAGADARQMLIGACCALYDTSNHVRRPLRPELGRTEQSFWSLLERERRYNKDPGYGGFLLPAMGVYAALTSPQDRENFRHALLRFMQDTGPQPRGVRSRPEFARTMCGAFLIFGPELAMDESEYVLA